MRISMGGGGGMVGGGGGAGAGMMEDPTLWSQITAFLDTLPAWLSTIIIAGAVILGAMLVGWIVGQIVGRVIYPNPDKPSVLNKKEKMIYIGALSLAVLLVVVMVTPKADEDMAVNGDMAGMGGDISASGEMNPAVNGMNPSTDGATANPDTNASSDATASTDTDSSSSSTADVDESSSSEASSSSTAGSDTPAPNVSVNPVTPKTAPALG